MGVDAGTGYIYSIEATAISANSGCLGLDKRPEIPDDAQISIDYRIAQGSDKSAV